MARLSETYSTGDVGHEAVHEKLSRKANYVFDVTDFGAAGDGSTVDTVALQAAYDALAADGGGVLLFPPKTFVGGVVVDTDVPVVVSGYGATLVPEDYGVAVDVDAGNGSSASGITVEGLTIDGATVALPTGVRVVNTDRVRMRDVRVESCATGVMLFTESSGWVEGTLLESVFVSNCTTGVWFNPDSGTSFGETTMIDVGVDNCTTGVKVAASANIYRSRLLGVTCWVNTNQTGFDIGGDVRGVTAQWAVESIGSPTGATGVWVAATATNLDRMLLQLEFTGSVNTPVGSAGPYLVWSEGNQWNVSVSGQGAAAFGQYGDTWPRVRVDNGWAGGGGFSFGPGDAAFDVNLFRHSANVLKTDDVLAAGGGHTEWHSGSGTPEGSVTAPSGSFYLRTDGGSGTTLYVKESGAGDTGWAAATTFATAKFIDDTDSPYTVLASDTTIMVDSTTATVWVTLPDTATMDGQGLIVKRIAGANAVTVNRSGSDVFDTDGASDTQKSLDTVGAQWSGVASGDNDKWFTVGEHGTVT